MLIIYGLWQEGSSIGSQSPEGKGVDNWNVSRSRIWILATWTGVEDKITSKGIKHNWEVFALRMEGCQKGNWSSRGALAL